MPLALKETLNKGSREKAPGLASISVSLTIQGRVKSSRFTFFATDNLHKSSALARLSNPKARPCFFHGKHERDWLSLRIFEKNRPFPGIFTRFEALRP